MTISIINNQSTDSYGRSIVRTAAADAGSTMYYSGPFFTAAKENSVIWQKRDALTFAVTDRAWATISLKKPDGTATSVEAEAGITVIDILVTKNFELMGGGIAVPNVLPVGDDNHAWRLWVYAAIDVPTALGGQVPFVEGITLGNFYEGEHIVIDGRSPKLLRYLDLSNVPVVQHAAGLAHISTAGANLSSWITASGYDGTGWTNGQILVLQTSTDTTLWVSHKHNGGSTGTSSDFGVGTLNYGWLENKLRFILQHPTGLEPSTVPADVANFQITLDSFIKWV